MLADRRFDAIRSTSPDWFTLESATEREFDIRRQNVSNIPAQLSVTNAWIDALRRANRVNEAIDVIGSAAQPGPHADPNSLTGWTDEINSLRWFMNQRADLLWQIGELQDAKAQLQEARVTFAAEGRTHVDQTINLARYYARSGQSGRAVEAVDGLDNLSTYGEMIVRYVRLMAAVADGSQEGIWRQIEFMERNRDDSLFLYQRALIMAGRLDEAAEFLIERLAGDVTRVGALVEMQTYLDDQPSAILAPLDIRYAEQKRQLLEREDVRAAIEPVGRVQAYPVWFAGFEIFDLADD
jgi:tetratricopeptide (TPR) repeat protein